MKFSYILSVSPVEVLHQAFKHIRHPSIHPSSQPSFHLSIYYCFASFAIVLSHEIHHWIVAIMWRSSVCFCDAAFVLPFLSQSFMCISVFKWRHLLKCSRTVVIKNGERKHYIFVFEEHTGKRQNGNNNLLPNTLLKQFFSPLNLSQCWLITCLVWPIIFCGAYKDCC